jgi:hypothetical protein
MGTEEDRDVVVIETTDSHLPRAIGEALHRAYEGELEYLYTEEEYYLDVSWKRQASTLQASFLRSGSNPVSRRARSTRALMFDVLGQRELRSSCFDCTVAYRSCKKATRSMRF